MPRQTDQRPIRRCPARQRFLVSPDLRGNDVDIMETRRQHTDVRRKVHVVINLILPIEV